MFAYKKRSALAGKTIITAVVFTAMLATTSFASPPPDQDQQSDASGSITARKEAPQNTGYDEPHHVDETVEIDPETGERIVSRAGITQWEDIDASPPVGLRALSASVGTPLSATVTPPTGTIGQGAEPRIRIDLQIPESARAGDVYPVTLNTPWIFSSSRAMEIKDAAGQVFAVAQPTAIEKDGHLARWEIRIVLTEEVENHANIRGFVDLALGRAQNRTTMVRPIIVTSGATELTRTSGQWTANGIPQQVESVTINGGAMQAGKPAIAPVIRIGYNRIPAAGWKVTLTAISSGLNPVCVGATQVQVADANGWISNQSGQATVESCTPTSATFVVTRAMAQAIGATGTVPVNIRAYFTGDKAATAYTLRLTSNVALEGITSWDLTAVTGEGGSAGADYLSLKTVKTAAFALTEGNAKPTIGDKITYTITTEPGAANDRPIENVMTSDALPVGLRFISADNKGTYDSASRTVSWGPRYLSTTGKLVDRITAEVISIPAGASLHNVAVNTADGLCGENDSLSVCSAEVKTPLAQPSFIFKKHAKLQDTNDNGWIGDQGDTIKYTFTVENNGEATLTSAVLTDKKLGISNHECLTTPLVPGASATCTVDFKQTITEADVTHGSVTNSATVCVDPKFNLPCGEDSTNVPTIRPDFTFQKSVATLTDPSGKPLVGQDVREGDKILFHFRVTNTGNVPLEQIYVTDPMLGVNQSACLSSNVVLAPGASTDCTSSPAYTHTVTATDVDNGEVHNVATGRVPGLPEKEDDTRTPVKPDPLVPELPKTGATGSLPLILAGGLLSMVGIGIVATQYLYSVRSRRS